MADLFEVKTIYIIIKVNEISKDYKGINWIFASFSLLTYSASIFDWEIWQEFVTTITLSSRETWRETSIRSGRDFMRWNFLNDGNSIYLFSYCEQFHMFLLNTTLKL